MQFYKIKLTYEQLYYDIGVKKMIVDKNLKKGIYQKRTKKQE